MRKMDRVKAVLSGQKVDRPPVSLWMHYPSVDQDPLALAKVHINYQEKYDFDFIKVTQFDLYPVQDWGCQIQFFCTQTAPPIIYQHAIRNITDWRRLEVLPATVGTWGKQMLVTKHIKSLIKPDVPFTQTVYSPLTVARKLAGDRLAQDLREDLKLYIRLWK